MILPTFPSRLGAQYVRPGSPPRPLSLLLLALCMWAPVVLAQQCETPALTVTLHAPDPALPEGQRYYTYSVTHNGERVDITWRGHTKQIFGSAPIDHDTLDSSCMAGTETLRVTAYKGCGSHTIDTAVTPLDTTPKFDIEVLTGAYTTQFNVYFQFPQAGNGTISATFLAASGAIHPVLHEYVPAGGGRSVPGVSEGGTLVVEGVSCVNQKTTTTASGGTGGSCSIAKKACPDCVGTPVHTMSGNMRYEDADPIAGFAAIPFVRNYDSQSVYTGHFGNRWSSIFDATLRSYTGITGSEYVNIRTEGGDQYVYQGSAGTYVQLIPKRGRADRAASLVKDASGAWTHTDPDGRTARVFSTAGVPVTYRDIRTGREVHVSWQAAVPTGVSDSWGSWSYTITADANGRVQSMALGGDATQTWTYTYDQHMLTHVNSPVGRWRRYVYEYIPVNGQYTPLAEAYDGGDHLIEKHTYDLALARSSLQATDDITHIAPLLAGRDSSESLTEVTYKTGRVEKHYKRLIAGEWRTVEIDGGCSSCGGRTTTTAFDETGNLVRAQNAEGYITTDDFDAIGRTIRTTTALRPAGCDPVSAADHCRQTADTLPDVVLEETPESTTTEYSYTDANWLEHPTIVRTKSVLQPDEWRTQTFTYDAITGDVLTSTISGWSGTPATLQTRTRMLTLYAGGEPAAFDPGGVFQPSWALLEQPTGLRKSIDGPRTDVVDVETMVYYPIDASVPQALRGRLAAQKNAAGHITRFTAYDLHGNATTIIDPNSVVHTFVYDAIGRLVQSTVEPVAGCDTAVDPLCATALITTQQYYGTGPLQSETRPGGGVTLYEYDERGRLSAISRGPSATDLRERLSYEYDPNTGNRSRESISAREGLSWVEKTSTSYTYDTFGRVHTVVRPDSSTMIYKYDADHVASVQDENHSTPNTHYEYDPRRRLKNIRQTLASAPEGEAVTSYIYDLDGNLASVTDPNGNVTTYAYDDFGALSSLSSPITGVTMYVHDSAGQLLSAVDANGSTTARTYDVLGRVLTTTATRTGVATETTTWTYDDTTSPYAIGRVSTMTDPAGATHYSYTRAGELRRESRLFTGTAGASTTVFSYDPDGNRATIKYPSGSTAVYTHDYAGRPLSVTFAGQPVIISAAYAAFGPLQSLTFANGTTQTISHDNQYRIDTNELSDATGLLAKYDYAHDAKGNIIAIADMLNPAYDRTFTYDDLDRLTGASTGAALWRTAAIDYDVMGNLTALQLGDAESFRRRTLAFGYDGPTPRVATVTENGLERTVEHDAAGNETRSIVSRSYSARNFLRRVDEPSELSASEHWVEYGYDGRGVRVTRAESGLARRFYTYLPELRLLAVTADDAANVWGLRRGGQSIVSLSTPLPVGREEIIWFGDRPVAQVGPARAATPDPELARRRIGTMSIPADRAFYFTVTDHLGTPVIQTDMAGAIVWQAEYEPYGAIWEMRVGKGSQQPLRFPGQETAMTWEGQEEHYNIFRWYKSGWGRYSQADPIDQPSLEYSYAIGNPVLHKDALGLKDTSGFLTKPPGVLQKCLTKFAPTGSKFLGPIGFLLSIFLADDLDENGEAPKNCAKCTKGKPPGNVLQFKQKSKPKPQPKPKTWDVPPDGPCDDLWEMSREWIHYNVPDDAAAAQMLQNATLAYHKCKKGEPTIFPGGFRFP